MKRDRFAVVGFTKHRERAPFGDPEWEVHGMNALHYDMPLDRFPFTGWWQVHTREMVMRGQGGRGREEHIEWLRQCPFPVYVLDKSDWEDIPNAIQVPTREIEKLNPRIGGYHTSSVTWMVGWGILQKFKEIHVYGIDMASDQEYRFQRPACEAWLAFAEGLGIKTYTPPESDLFNTVAQYGRGDQAAFRTLIHGKVQACMDRIGKIQENLGQLRLDYQVQTKRLTEEFQKKERQLLKELHHFEGQIIQCNDLLQNYTVPEAGGGSPYGVQMRSQQGQLVVAPQGDGTPKNRIAVENA